MRGVLSALVALFAVAAFAQEATDYTTAENPFQAEYPFSLGQPTVLRVDIQRVLIDSLALASPATLPPDGTVRVSVRVAGSNERSSKVTVTAVILLEDASGQGLERLSLEPFKVKGERPIDETQTLDVPSAALAAAARVYVFVKID